MHQTYSWIEEACVNLATLELRESSVELGTRHVRLSAHRFICLPRCSNSSPTTRRVTFGHWVLCSTKWWHWAHLGTVAIWWSWASRYARASTRHFQKATPGPSKTSCRCACRRTLVSAPQSTACWTCPWSRRELRIICKRTSSGRNSRTLSFTIRTSLRSSRSWSREVQQVLARQRRIHPLSKNKPAQQTHYSTLPIVLPLPAGKRTFTCTRCISWLRVSTWTIMRQS